jgi:hypothetical protein
MRITFADSRTLAIALTLPAADKFYNYTTGGWEQPFNPANHLKPITPLEASPSLFANVVTVDVGEVMIQRSDVAAVIMTVDSTGAPIAAVDVWTLPNPIPDPTHGGWCRSR